MCHFSLPLVNNFNKTEAAISTMFAMLLENIAFSQINCTYLFQHAPGVPKILVGNRLHLAYKRQVSEGEAEAYAVKNEMAFFEVSPLCDFNVTESFAELSRVAIKRNGMTRTWGGHKGDYCYILYKLCYRLHLPWGFLSIPFVILWKHFCVWTFNLVYLVVRTIHKFKIPMKYVFKKVILCIIWKSTDSSVHEHVLLCQHTKLCAIGNKWFHSIYIDCINI